MSGDNLSVICIDNEFFETTLTIGKEYKIIEFASSNAYIVIDGNGDSKLHLAKKFTYPTPPNLMVAI